MMKRLNASALRPQAGLVAGILLASCLGVAQAQAPAAPSGPVVASLGTIAIGQDDVARLLQSMPERERAAAKADRPGVEALLRQRLTSEALLQEAQSKGWAARPEIKARVDAAVQEITARIVSTTYLESVAQVPADYPSDADLRAAYDQNKGAFDIPASYRVAQIFLPARNTDTAEVAKVRAEAKTLSTQARQGDFAALARSRSQDKTSAARGGEVGTLPLAQMLPETRDVVAKLKPGQVSEPVQSEAGFHVMKLLESQPPRTATFDEVKPRLQGVLRQQRQQQLAQSYVAGLAQSGSLKIDSAALDAVLQKTN